ncbi:WD repeat-containing protein 46-like [Lineus longissimus]|uniref:WD repeat-containing protein 46-like n=1 Tax=Lineus longissimus TaxID=88925 RepID=UPI00315D16B4
MKRLNNKGAENAKKSRSGKDDFRRRGFRSRVDKFPGDAPIPKERIKKYERGEEMSEKGLVTKDATHDYSTKQKKYNKAFKQAARTEILLPEEEGFLQFDDDEDATKISQRDIADAVDITSAQKYFELKLPQFGPYHMNFTRNGRHLLLGGKKGHAAAIDWQTKKLMCEMNVMETIHAVQWLHIETMFAVAQKQWTYIYDNQGIELHCLKSLDCVLQLEFLPYHFLLVSSNSKGYLSYLDVSIGQKVAGISTGLGRLGVMCQNPSNAIVHLGHSAGVVSLWSPNVKEPLVKMLCHSGAVRSLTVDKKGNYMATSGVDRTIKIWDLRMLKMLQSYKVHAGASSLSFSQTGLLGAGIGSVVQVFRDCCTRTATSPYMQHQLASTVQDLQFCPYEDVIGASHGQGYSSLLIPGAGVANFDALEENPYQTKKQRRHAEVNMLLEKIQPDLITLDTSKLGEVDVKTLQEKLDERNKLLYLKPKKVDFEPRYKKKGKSKAGRVENRKRGVQFEKKKEHIKQVMKEKQKMKSGGKREQRPNVTTSALDRFKKK